MTSNALNTSKSWDRIRKGGKGGKGTTSAQPPQKGTTFKSFPPKKKTKNPTHKLEKCGALLTEIDLFCQNGTAGVSKIVCEDVSSQFWWLFCAWKWSWGVVQAGSKLPVWFKSVKGHSKSGATNFNFQDSERPSNPKKRSKKELN